MELTPIEVEIDMLSKAKIDYELTNGIYDYDAPRLKTEIYKGNHKALETHTLIKKLYSLYKDKIYAIKNEVDYDFDFSAIGHVPYTMDEIENVEHLYFTLYQTYTINGNLLIDKMGNNNAILIGDIYYSKPSGENAPLLLNALNFDGNGDRVFIDNEESPEFDLRDQNYYISLYINPQNQSDEYGTILSKYKNETFMYKENSFLLKYYDNTLEYRHYDGEESYVSLIASDINVGNLYKLEIVKIKNELQFVINEKEITTMTCENQMTSSNHDIYIGANDTSNSFMGLVSDIRFKSLEDEGI